MWGGIKFVHANHACEGHVARNVSELDIDKLRNVQCTVVIPAQMIKKRVERSPLAYRQVDTGVGRTTPAVYIA